MAVEWTDEDIATLKENIRSGVLTVKFAGPPAREVTFQSLEAMRQLLADMNRQVSGAPTHRYVRWKRGFRDSDS